MPHSKAFGIPHVALLFALAVAQGGCAVPQGIGRVSDELAQRTGYELTEAEPGETVLPPAVSLAHGLSQDDAVAIALWNNAALRATLADLGLSRADLIQAGMLPNPTFSMFVPVGPKPLETTFRYPLEVLWLRPYRVAAARADYESTAEHLVQSALDLIRDVRVAYSDVALADGHVAVAQETASLAEQIAELTAARAAAGDISELDADTARVDTLQAHEQLARARYDAGMARERLRNLLGTEATPLQSLADPGVPPRVEEDAGRLVEMALAARPDLHAADLALEAAGERSGLARAEVFAFAAGVSAKEEGNQFLTGPAFDLTIPILNQNQGSIARADAAVEKASRQYVSARDRVVLEVREAHIRLRQAQESFTTWNARILPPLTDTVRRAERAYAAGDVSFLFVLDAARKLSAARVKEVDAAAELRRAAAELERSIGGRLPIRGDIPERAV
ncbi:MAG: TolC family protein [Candidatus Binatia bacterium]